jgi:hypothetical protein
MGQCISSGMKISNCEKFKKAIDILLKKPLQQGIFEAGFKHVYKTLYPNEEITNEDFNCMLKYLSDKLLEEINLNSTVQDSTVALTFSNNRLSGITKSLEILTKKFSDSTNSKLNTQIQDLEIQFNESELIGKMLANDECGDITEAEAEAELNKILHDVDVEIAEELKKQMSDIPGKKGGNTNQHKEDIKHLRKLLKNKKLTDNQKEQYLKKIDSIKSKIQKQNKTDKINKCKEHIKNLQKTLKNKNITESQKQQCHHNISNYKLKMEELK